MTGDEGLLAWVGEALASATITSRAMMGGRTFHADGVVFAILANDQLWLKANAASDAEWDTAGAERLTYRFDDGRTGSMNYRRAPDDCYDVADALNRWAALALAAGQRMPVRNARR